MGSRQAWGTGEMALSAFQQHFCISAACMAVLASALATLEDRNIIYFTVRYRRGFIKHVNRITKEGH